MKAKAWRDPEPFAPQWANAASLRYILPCYETKARPLDTFWVVATVDPFNGHPHVVSIVAPSLLDCDLEVDVFLASEVATQKRDLFEEILRFELVSLLEVPKPVIFPRPYMVRVRRECLIVPDFREVIIGKLAISVADVVCDVRVVIMAESSKRDDCLGVLAIKHKISRRMVTAHKLLIFPL